VQKLTSLASLAAALFGSSAALATTYQVGPDKPYQSLEELAYALEPGDVVEVDGDVTYPGGIHIRTDSSGAPGQPVIVRGIRRNGKRPIIEGGDEYGIVLNASHFVFEGFEVTGAADMCVVHKGDQIVIRDVVVHDCPGQGILGTDFESGSLTIEFTEVYACGSDLYQHQVYVASDESMYPGSVFRLQHSYIHDGNGGNNVKSRFERNEIYANWIEAPVFHVLDLIGPDGQDPGLAREDSDVVGNVLIQGTEWSVARMGGDGTGATAGRYRFAYNTIVVSGPSSGIFRVQDEIESLAVHDNVFLGTGAAELWMDDGAAWTTGAPQLSAERNWVQIGLTAPSFFSATLTGADPGFEDAASGLFVPAEGSPLVDAGAPGAGPPGYEVPSALAVPTFVAPVRGITAELTGVPRPSDAVPDIGAYELGTRVTPGPTTASTGPGGGPSGGGADGGEDGGGGDADSGCACAAAGRSNRSGAIGAIVLAGLSLFARRRRPRPCRGRTSARA
jgi:MYXO-CTERM domain-containing protein